MLQPNIHLAALTRRWNSFSFFCGGECGSAFVRTTCTQCIVHIYIYMMHMSCIYGNMYTYTHTEKKKYIYIYVQIY